MATINIWQQRYTTGEVLIADHKLEKDNTIVIEKGEGAGSYYLAGSIAKTFPIEDMPTKDHRTIRVRAVPLKELEKETIAL